MGLLDEKLPTLSLLQVFLGITSPRFQNCRRCEQEQEVHHRDACPATRRSPKYETPQTRQATTIAFPIMTTSSHFLGKLFPCSHDFAAQVRGLLFV